MGVTTGTLTVLVDRLEERGLVQRSPHMTDRRSIMVELTDSGRTEFEEHDRLHIRLTEEICAGLSDEDKDALLRCLLSMNRMF
jgi:DNA-binding MarR family transcriptional regulator